MHLWSNGTFVKRGFLYGPICPIYGFGAVILIVVNDLISKKTDSIIVKTIVMTIIFTVFEYIVSFVFETIFGIRWWDYTNEFLNLHGRVCLMFSLVWAVGTILFIKLFYQPLEKIIQKIREKIPCKFMAIVLIIAIIGTITDFVLSVLKYIK